MKKGSVRTNAKQKHHVSVALGSASAAPLALDHGPNRGAQDRERTAVETAAKETLLKPWAKKSGCYRANEASPGAANAHLVRRWFCGRDGLHTNARPSAAMVIYPWRLNYGRGREGGAQTAGSRRGSSAS